MPRIRIGYGHGSFPIEPQPGTPPVGTQIAMEGFSRGVSGTQLLSGGCPLIPGQLFENQLDWFRLFLGTNNLEQAIAIVALHGTFPDGSLRGVGLQCRHDVDIPVTGFYVIDPAGRGTQDISWIEPTYSMMLDCGIIIPSDPAYLCATDCALTPLQPASVDSATTRAMFGVDSTEELGEWLIFESNPAIGNAQIGNPTPGAALYDHIGGLFAAWIRSGNKEYYKRGLERLLDNLKGRSTPTPNPQFLAGSGTTSYAKVTGWDPSIAVGVPASNSGLGSEWNSAIAPSWATSYLVTGWRQPWVKICHSMSWEMGNAVTYASARSKWMGSQYGIRFNTKRSLGSGIVAYIMDGTMQVPGGYGAGRNPSRSFIQDMQWIVDAWWDDRYQTGDFRDGITGQKSTITGNCAHTPQVAGHHPIFQQMVIAQYMILFYQRVYQDPRLITMLESTAAFLITQFYSNGGRMFSDYEVRTPPVTSGGAAYWIPFFPHIFGFLYAVTGNNLYKTWCGHAINRNCLNAFTKQMKAFGEYFSHIQQSAAYYYDGGSALGPVGTYPTAYREPAIHTF